MCKVHTLTRCLWANSGTSSSLVGIYATEEAAKKAEQKDREERELRRAKIAAYYEIEEHEVQS